jgi:hypothetical protein
MPIMAALMAWQAAIPRAPMSSGGLRPTLSSVKRAEQTATSCLWYDSYVSILQRASAVREPDAHDVGDAGVDELRFKAVAEGCEKGGRVVDDRIDTDELLEELG